jgi:DNA-directed RNA polymerase specialized sigma24 family protein
MRDPDLFDAFYKDARERLLLQTYALTGDLAASRAAVRDAFIVAWHHWRKVSALDDPEEWVRPHAWRHAQRRHTARLWHRDKDIDADVKATLDALGKLPITQRRALLLTQLATVSMPQMSREIGLPQDDAERELQVAVTQFSLLRAVPAAELRTVFEPLLGVVAAAHWPRGSIIRRAGSARRRTHTTIGAVAALAAVVVTGSMVTDAAGVRPTLDRDQPAASTNQESLGDHTSPSLTPTVMVGETAVVKAIGGQGWKATTGDNSDGTGLATHCQRERYADPQGTGALLRTFEAKDTKRGPTKSALQVTELSGTQRAARRTFATTLGWYAGCMVERTQLISTRRITAVGDQAMLVVLRAWDDPLTTMTVGIARTGNFTTTTVTMVGDEARPNVEGNTELLASAVSELCTLPEGGECSGAAEARQVAPLPLGKAPAMLTEIDLPPVSDVNRPWVGTDPERATDNLAATRCDDAKFTGTFNKAEFAANWTRTFLIPEADLPDEFGLTETVATLPERRAKAFVEQVRDRLGSCEAEDDGLGTEVERVANFDDGKVSLSAWELTIEVTERRSIDYTMAIMRRGTAIAQLSFVSAPKAEMADGAFVDLAYRALARLVELPKPGTSD